MANPCLERLNEALLKPEGLGIAWTISLTVGRVFFEGNSKGKSPFSEVPPFRVGSPQSKTRAPLSKGTD